MYDSFDSVRQLDTAQQRELLIQGDGIERVWAAWAIALSFGSASASFFRTSLNDEPHPGIRRHLIAILAGLGERSVLTTFAQHDPDIYVRATACQYLARVCQPTDTALQAFLRERIFSDHSQLVTCDLLSVLRRECLFLEENDFRTLLAHSDREVRITTIEALLRIFDHTSLFPGILEAHISYETDESLRNQLIARAIHQGGVARIIRNNQHNRAVIADILMLVDSAPVQADWNDLQCVTQLDDPQLDCLVLQLLQGQTVTSAPMLDWLCTCHIRARPYRYESWYSQPQYVQNIRQASYASRSYFTSISHSITHTSIETSLLEKIRTSITMIEDERALLDTSEGPEEYDDDDEYDDDEEWLLKQKSVFDQQIQSLQRLLP